MQKMQKIIAIVGPTAVGKSALAVRLARTFNGEVISADSRQVYKGLDIGTGKITKKEMRSVPHHLLDVANPRRQFTVVDYQKLACEKIKEIHSRGNVPIIVGGTGLYIDTLLGKFAIPDVPPSPKLRRRLEKKPLEALFALLQKLDPRRAKAVDPRNPRRLVRAIEIAKALGRVPRYSVILKNNRIPLETLSVGLTLPKEHLRRKIRSRLTKRVEGMTREAGRLHAKGLSWKRMEELGLEYRYISRYVRGLFTRDEMLQKLETEIWHYAKRQFTWFKRNKEIKWFQPTEKQAIERTAAEFISA